MKRYLLLVLVAMILGFFIVKVEPAVYVAVFSIIFSYVPSTFFSSSTKVKSSPSRHSLPLRTLQLITDLSEYTRTRHQVTVTF